MNETRGWAYSLTPFLSGVWSAYVACPLVALMLRVLSDSGIVMNVSPPSGWHGASGR